MVAFWFIYSFDFTENLHEFFASNRLMLNQIFRQLIQGIPVPRQILHCFLIAFFQDFHDLLVNLSFRSISAIQHSPPIQIFIFNRFQADQPKFFCHTILCNHRASK